MRFSRVVIKLVCVAVAAASACTAAKTDSAPKKPGAESVDSAGSISGRDLGTAAIAGTFGRLGHARPIQQAPIPVIFERDTIAMAVSVVHVSPSVAEDCKAYDFRAESASRGMARVFLNPDSLEVFLVHRSLTERVQTRYESLVAYAVVDGSAHISEFWLKPWPREVSRRPRRYLNFPGRLTIPVFDSVSSAKASDTAESIYDGGCRPLPHVSR